VQTLQRLAEEPLGRLGATPTLHENVEHMPGVIDRAGGNAACPERELTFNGGVVATSPVHFTADTGTLGLADPAGFAATVFDFQADDAVDFTSITSTGSITAGVNGSNELTLTSSGTLLTEVQFDPTQSFAGEFFKAAPDGGSGTIVTIEPLCFLAGTRIATLSGETPVEQLTIGDLVLTARGKMRPIVWIGVGRVLATRGRRSAATPVIVRKGALADNVPHRDLRMTKAHSLFMENALFPIEFLVNHRSILWDDRAQEISLYHIELETHDVLLADGALAESYRDDGNRWLFRNANTAWDSPPKPPCAPVLTDGPMVDTIWRRLLDRTGPRPGLPTTDDPDLHLLVDGQIVEGSTNPMVCICFVSRGVLAACTSPRAPVSQRSWASPAIPGFSVRRVALRQGGRFQVMDASDPLLTEGFHEFEVDNRLRRTDEDATLPAPLFEVFDGPLELMVQIGGTARYPLTGTKFAMAMN
jgi:hypothetical protein